MNILLVEDNPGDVRLTQEALRESNLSEELTLHVVPDGVEALDYLGKRGKHVEAVNPDLILLDLNLPKKHGSEVLSEIKNSTELRSIPVVVLTTSQADQDIEKVYNLHANCYISKPVDINEFIDVIKSIENFWFNIVKLPSFNKV